MAENKKGFLLYSDSYGLIKQLPDDVAGRLLKHIFSFVNDENPTSEELLLNIAFEPIKMHLKRDLKKYENQLQQRKDAGLKSAEVRKRNATSVNERSISSTDRENDRENDSDNVKENDNVSANENDILLEKETKAKNLKFKIPNLQEVQNYCNERKNGISAFKFINFYQSKDWMVGKNKMKDWQAAIRTWETDKPTEKNGTATAKSNRNR